MFKRLFSICVIATVAGSASARIPCQGNFQITANGPIATPYCEDNNLAAVARAYGARVSDVAIRQNPILKASICRFIGYDLRVRDTCSGFIDYGDGRH